MNEILYSGRSVQNLKKLIPQKSTYGKEYVYATDDYVIAAVFTRIGEGSICFRLSIDKDNITLQELIPNAFKCLYDHPISIYSVSSKTFKKENIPSVINEYESSVEVDIINEEKYDSGLTLIKKLANENKINLINYDEKFKKSFLINKQIKYYEDTKREITKNTFNDIIFYHPELLNKLKLKGFEYSIDEIVNIYVNKINNLKGNNFNNFIDSALISLKKYDENLYYNVINNSLDLISKSDKNIIKK